MRLFASVHMSSSVLRTKRPAPIVRTAMRVVRAMIFAAVSLSLCIALAIIKLATAVGAPVMRNTIARFSPRKPIKTATDVIAAG